MVETSVMQPRCAFEVSEGNFVYQLTIQFDKEMNTKLLGSEMLIEFDLRTFRARRDLPLRWFEATYVSQVPSAAVVQQELNARFEQTCLRFQVQESHLQRSGHPDDRLPWDINGNHVLDNSDSKETAKEFEQFLTEPTFSAFKGKIFHSFMSRI